MIDLSCYDNSNIFARILRKEIPSVKIYEDEFILAFEDIAPKAAVHILVIPKQPCTCFDDFISKTSPQEQVAFWSSVSRVLEKLGLSNHLSQEDVLSGYRLVINSGEAGGQEVPHFHVHILAGEPLPFEQVSALPR